MAIKLSSLGKWKRLILPYHPVFMGDFIFLAFVPETGRHLAVFPRRAGKRGRAVERENRKGGRGKR